MPELVPHSLPVAAERLWSLFQRQVALYNYGNTSLPVETAQELMAGVDFTVALGAHAPGGPEQQFAAGRIEIDRLLRKSRTLLAGVQKTALETENLSYSHTLACLPHFFTAYDKNFFPNDIPCDIDYQTALPMLGEPTQGVVWFCEYLRRVLLENQFCAIIQPPVAAAILRGAYPSLREDLVNLYTPLLLAALGASLLGKPCQAPCLDDADRTALSHRLDRLCPDELEALLKKQAGYLCETYLNSSAAQLRYAGSIIERLMPTIARALQVNNLRAIFPGPGALREAPSPTYAEGQLLPAEKLRALIEEGQSCRFTSDKLAILEHDIHSLRDFTDYMDNCLQPHECPAAFALLEELEIQALCLRLAEEHPQDPPHWGQMLLACLGEK